MNHPETAKLLPKKPELIGEYIKKRVASILADLEEEVRVFNDMANPKPKPKFTAP